MSTNRKPIVPVESSKLVGAFLDSNKLHKKDFAQMIGVTLSYVYNLIDNSIPFSTRAVTLERIATVMDILPEEFEEYKIPQEPMLIDKAVDFVKDKIKAANMNTVQYLKAFERKKRLYVVDILRGARPLPVDWQELENIAKPISLSRREVYALWQNRMLQFLESGGVNINANTKLLERMFGCAKEYIMNMD